VLTAAHCLYDEKASAFVMDVSFAPGRYQAGGKNVDPFGIAKMSFISIADAYFKSKGTAYDYGVLTVGSPIGLRTGTFGLKAASCSGSEYVWSAVAGYPGDKAGSNGQCWYSKCWVLFNKPCSGEPVYYSCDTSVGQSGAPVFDQDRYIRAVHVAMAEMQAPNGQKFAANVGTPIFPAVFDAIAGV
jgi:V8-like Glu-specific endopeptidase